MVSKIFGKLIDWMYGRNLSMKESLFRMIVVVGACATIIGILETIIALGFHPMLIPLVSVSFVMILASVITFRFHQVTLASFMVWFSLSFVLFPLMFLASGGVRGGAAIWFVLAFFYTFIMFSNVTLIVTTFLNIVAVAATYVFSYLYPEKVWMLPNTREEFVDSAFGVITVGIVVGMIVLFQILLYQKEHELAEMQNRQLEESKKMQNAFFASMSHEIRTPINSVIGLNEMILHKSNQNEIKEYSKNINSASKMLLELINDILDYSQIEQRRMQIILGEYDSADMIHELVDMIKVRIQEKKLEFVVQVDPQLPRILYGDQKRVTQILVNLLTNAVKYTNEGFVLLRLESEKAEADMVELTMTVKDTGIGIRKEDLDRLYDAFQRVDERRNVRVEGSGLGLSITKQLIGMMDGDITVDSIYTKGSTFTVKIKQRVIDAQPIGEIDFLKTALGTEDSITYEALFEAPEVRILLVDDNEMNAMVVSNLLADTKMKVDIAQSGMECLDKTKKKYYHAILMDYKMPDMDGAETLQSLRRQENGLCRETPVILMTASSSSDAKRIADKYGFDAFLEKPILSERLQCVVLKMIPDELVEYRRKNNTSLNVENLENYKNIRRKNLIITTDCVADIAEEKAERYGLKIMYLYIRTEKGRFADTIEIDSDNIPQYLKNGEVGAYADSVSVEEYEDFFAEALTQAENVLHISMAANCGKSFHVATTAAKGFGHVRIIDSGFVSGGQALLVRRAVMLARAGRTIDEICEIIEKSRNNICARFTSPGAEVFYKRGYTDLHTAKLCKTLHAHPVYSLKKSRIFICGVQFGEQYRYWRKFIQSVFCNEKKIDTEIAYVTYVNLNDKELEFIQNEIKRCIDFKYIVMQKSSFSNACNVGDHTFGISYWKKEQ